LIAVRVLIGRRIRNAVTVMVYMEVLLSPPLREMIDGIAYARHSSKSRVQRKTTDRRMTIKVRICLSSYRIRMETRTSKKNPMHHQPQNFPRENSEMRPFWIDFENTANPRQAVIVDSTE
jgi:hypothetical protein